MEDVDKLSFFRELVDEEALLTVLLASLGAVVDVSKRTPAATQVKPSHQVAGCDSPNNNQPNRALEAKLDAVERAVPATLPLHCIPFKNDATINMLKPIIKSKQIPRGKIQDAVWHQSTSKICSEYAIF